MAQNLTQPSPYEDEIDLREIFKILIESKKLIISTILIFTIASIIYSLSLKPSFKSSTILEIGYYEMPDGNQKLIEKPSSLISDLKVLIMKNQDDKFSQNISMNSFEEKLINLKTTSSSSEQNENILNEIINYIDERHSNLAVLITDQKKHQISNEIERNETKLSFIKAKQLDNNLLKRTEIEDRIAQLKAELPIIDLEISQLEKVIIDDTNNLSLLKRNENIRTERASNSPTLEQIIFSYKSKINGFNTKKNTNLTETKSLNNHLQILENVTFQSDELFRLDQEQKILENQLQMLMNETQVKTLPIGNIETQTIKPKTQLMILLGIIMGFIAGILLVFIRNFVKSYRESQA
ncbi:Wzz/FepE/Etk N-terminal domain-containing protein [Candidatus Pseudothioglobus singularis]|nr:Wzz/FepE/Etk N-terminal domain-containing protein [Candidatus Pseudothioglobus singularis]